MMAPPPVPTIGQYHHPEFDWSRVGRVLVLPVHNNSAYTRTGAEVRHALSGELQKLAAFEIVTPPPDHPACHSEVIHVNGRFDEGVMIALAREFNADIILHASVTQYSPYPRPRLGLVVQAVSPIDAKVVASVDGLWDTSDADVACRVREFYRAPTAYRRFPRLAPRNQVANAYDGYADELALESPALFQRFVAHEIVANLQGPADISLTSQVIISPIPPQ